MSSCRDLRDNHEDINSLQDAFSKLVSGKAGYKTVIQRAKEPILCPACSKTLSGEERFCPECGEKLKQ